jgi:hypothetical protein
VNTNVWNKLPQATKDVLQAEMKKLEDKSWKVIEEETEEGVTCNTGGACSVGPTGKLKLVKPSAEDIKARDKALNDVVLARWAKRCGEECATKWNEIVGKKYGLTAKAN